MSTHVKPSLVLSDSAIEVLVLVVSALRKSTSPEAKTKDESDTRDLLHALTISGYCVIPTGTVELIKRLLTEGREF